MSEHTSISHDESGDQGHTDHSHGGHHIIPQAKLLQTFFVLMGLMIATVVAARLPYEGGVKGIPSAIAWLVLLGIAFWKAGLVVQIFMGVKYSTKLTKLYAYGGFFWVTLLGVTLFDYATRQLEPVQGWEPVAESALPR
jgi:caa(3)-type oxidase subunit IV